LNPAQPINRAVISAPEKFDCHMHFPHKSGLRKANEPPHVLCDGSKGFSKVPPSAVAVGDDQQQTEDDIEATD
jgi:hypothetical protein